jgi:hypothetical protein
MLNSFSKSAVRASSIDRTGKNAALKTRAFRHFLSHVADLLKELYPMLQQKKTAGRTEMPLFP